MASIHNISVKTGRPYEILIGRGLLQQLPRLLQPLCTKQELPRIAVITESTVDSLYGEQVCTVFKEAGFSVCKFVFPAGEAFKNLYTLEQIYPFLAEHQITRSDLILALGGGVTGDLAGYAAASWLRGIRFVQIPTTFLAMIDSSVGGKTGVDLPQGKNLVGAFWQPSLVVCDLDLLSSLPAEIFADGTAEAIKYGAILDEDLFERLAQGKLMEQLVEITARCIDWKRQVVEQDERDTGIRQCLNFGHTFGHAIEKYHQYAITHGKGVAIGMVMLCRACEQAGITQPGTADRIAACCARYQLPTSDPAPLDQLCQNCAGDKKRQGSTLTLVTLERIGKAVLYPIQTKDLYAFMGGDIHG